MKRKERYSPEHYDHRHHYHDRGQYQRPRGDGDRDRYRDRDRDRDRYGGGDRDRDRDRHGGGDRDRDRYAGGDNRPSYSGYRGGGDRGRGGGDRGGGGGGGYRGRGGNRGRGRPCSPVRKDVRKSASTVGIKTTIHNKQRGTEGQEVELVANYYPITLKPIPVFYYDIDIKLKMHSNSELRAFKGPFAEKVKVWNQVVVEWPQVFRPSGNRPVIYAFDGTKNLFTLTKLPIDAETQAVTRPVSLELDGYSNQTFQVAIKYIREADMKRIGAFFDKKTSLASNVTQYRDVLQVLDIVSHFWPQMTRITVGRNLFPMDSRDRIQEDKENTVIAFGHHQSVVMTESGLALNVDRSTTAFRSRATEDPLIDFIARELKVDKLSGDVWRRLGNRDITNLSAKLKDLKIYTSHIRANGNPQKRKHTIDRMASATPDQERIEKEGRVLTITQYFEETYTWVAPLKHTYLPLIQIKGGSPDNRKYLPAELCTVYPNQPMPRNLINPEIQNRLVESSNSMAPVKRFDKIQDARDSIVADDKPGLMKSFGLEISPNPIKLKGRQLTAPRINGMSGDRKTLETPVKGGLERYLFFNLSKEVKARGVQTLYDGFFNHPKFGLILTAGRMGLRMAAKPMDARLDLFTNDDLRDIPKRMAAYESAAMAAKKSFKKPNDIQMIFVVIPDVPQLYEHIKLLSDIQIGIPTQCVKEDNFLKTKPGYFNNLTFKINAKLDGRNQVLAPDSIKELPAFFTKEPTMVIGADVCHPGYHNPLANEKVISSIAAVVGSYDQQFTKYVANVSAQPARTEIIANFDDMVVNLLKYFGNKFKGKSGVPTYPKNIILFRDGVSESQFDAVRIEEVPLIEKAYQKLNAPIPKITAFVVQKRHHTRLMPTQFEGNMRAGTVVDHTITSPFYEEFHLCSHNGPLGTSRHAKYATIRDDHKMTADQKQKLAFYMCYAYCRCPTPISIPIAVKYADLAAYRTKQHTNQLNVRYEARGRDETEDQQRLRETRCIQLLNTKIKVHENLEFLPYYC